VKHSDALESLDPGMPLAESPLNTARQQYRPADVTYAVGDETVTGYDAPVRFVDPTLVPPVVQRPGESTLHRENATEPPGVAVPPVRLTTAESFTATTPVPIERPPAGMLFPAPSFGVVTVVDVQLLIGGVVARIVSL
jgi:hypothetical protein